jgi:glucose-6-phosphate 1-dehydrogenase
MAEDLGVGTRAGYYDAIGATRDVLQNHLLQLLALTAMERPASLAPGDVRAAKESLLAAVRLAGPPDQCTARGQYAIGWQGNQAVPGYLDEPGIPPDSVTDTFGAVKLVVDTPRWLDTPFYLRTGKRLGRRVTEIAVIFKGAPGLPGLPGTAGGDEAGPNTLVLRIQPDEGITLRVGTKVPATEGEVRAATMDFSYGHAFTEALPEAYELLFTDVLLGSDPFFPRQAEVAESWRVVDQVEQAWAGEPGGPEPYPAGTWGPPGADRLMQRDGREWRRP